MKIMRSSALVIVSVLFWTLAGCGGSGEEKAADTVTDHRRTADTQLGLDTADRVSSEEVAEEEAKPQAVGRISGLVRDANGLPVQVAVVSLLDARSLEPLAGDLTPDTFGAFDTGEVTMGDAMLKVQAAGYKTVSVTGLGLFADVSVTLPAGDGEVEVVLPEAPVLEATRKGADVTLTWTPFDGKDFHSFRVMRARVPAVSLLTSNVGILTDPAAAQMTDKNLPVGIMHYRVYLDIETADGHFLTGSNVVEVEVPSGEGMPANHVFIMMKTGLNKNQSMVNTAYHVIAPIDISTDIGAGKQITVTTPLHDNQPKKAMYIGKNMTNYKGNKNYYYGFPATFLGETRKLDEWDTKYAVMAEGWEADKRVGTHVFEIEGMQTSFEFAKPMPDSRVENVQLVRDEDGDLAVTWDLIEDGVPIAGGPGKYGWKYLVKILYPGIYISGGDPVFEAEKAWSNFDIFDKELNIGFTRVCEVAANMPQDVRSVKVPEGIFAPGDTVHVLVYAISTTESFMSPDSGIPGYGKAFVYWLFNYKVMVKVP